MASMGRADLPDLEIPMPDQRQDDAHSRHSRLREQIVEHVFIADVLRTLWRYRVLDVEVLRSEFDAGGYDVVLARGNIIRHIQLKASIKGGRRRAVDVNMNLADKPSGCVVWIVVDDGLSPDHYRWLGNPPGAPLPAIDSLKVGKHTKANSQGVKSERPMKRDVSVAMFQRIDTLEELLARLFGADTLRRTSSLPIPLQPSR
jgi:hypothetical protein